VNYNLARFDLVSVRLAVACAQTGSLTAAARDSHLALAAASRRIRELEDALGEACSSAMRAASCPRPPGASSSSTA
jgi:molybdenum-dependent DNA-binding transcriptional regulator ModE